MVQGQTRKSNTVVYPSRDRAVQLVIGVLILLGAMATVHYAPMPAQGASRDDLQIHIHELTVQIEQLRQEQSMPALVLNRYRNSIGYIYGIYHVGFSNQRPLIRARTAHVVLFPEAVGCRPSINIGCRRNRNAIVGFRCLCVGLHATNKDQEHPGRRLKKKMSRVRTFNKLLLRLIDLTICTLHGELVRLPELILKVHPFRR